MVLPTLTFAAALELAAGHGQLTYPQSRSGSNYDSAGGCPQLGSSTGKDYCAWNLDGVTHPGDRTLPDNMITSAGDSSEKNPWFAPGATSMKDQWGEYPCGKIEGKDGRTYPATERTIVQAGGTLEVAWAINANHGGGYSVRLCPSDSDLSEECFQKTVLKASKSVSWIQDGSDKGSRREIPALRTTTGTHPAGSEWTRNPIPDRQEFFTPPLGLYGHGPFPWNIVDEYEVPQLPNGDYTLSWRWDCEETEQIWANCADITIQGGSPGPAPSPSPSPAPSPSPSPSPTPVPPADQCDVPESSRQDCGHAGTQQSDCEASGCCWKPAGEGSSTPWCYQKNPSQIAV